MFRFHLYTFSFDVAGADNSSNESRPWSGPSVCHAHIHVGILLDPKNAATKGGIAGRRPAPRPRRAGSSLVDRRYARLALRNNAWYRGPASASA